MKKKSSFPDVELHPFYDELKRLNIPFINAARALQIQKTNLSAYLRGRLSMPEKYEKRLAELIREEKQLRGIAE